MNTLIAGVMRHRVKKGLSVVITALIVTTLLFVIFFSIVATQMRVSDAIERSLKLEAEKGLEDIQAYWKTSSFIHIKNTGDISVTLVYLVKDSYPPGGITTIPISPPVGVSPGEEIEFQPPVTQDPDSNYTLVSERGNSFFVHQAPPVTGGGTSFFDMTVDSGQSDPGVRWVRPTYSGFLADILLTASQSYPGDPVQLEYSSTLSDSLCGFNGISYSPNPVPLPTGGSSSSTMTGVVNGGNPGDSCKLVTIGYGSLGATRLATLLVNIADLYLSVPARIDVRRGGSGSDTVTVSANYGPARNVQLSCSTGQAGLDCNNLSPNPVSLAAGSDSKSATITVYADPSVPTGLYSATITADDNLGPVISQNTIICVYQTNPNTECVSVSLEIKPNKPKIKLRHIGFGFYYGRTKISVKSHGYTGMVTMSCVASDPRITSCTVVPFSFSINAGQTYRNIYVYVFASAGFVEPAYVEVTASGTSPPNPSDTVTVCVFVTEDDVCD